MLFCEFMIGSQAIECDGNVKHVWHQGGEPGRRKARWNVMCYLRHARRLDLITSRIARSTKNITGIALAMKAETMHPTLNSIRLPSRHNDYAHTE